MGVPNTLPAENVTSANLRTYIDDLKAECVSAPLAGESQVVVAIKKTDNDPAINQEQQCDFNFMRLSLLGNSWH